MTLLTGSESGPRAMPAAVGAAVLGAFFVSGACGLIHEIAWTRLLRHVMGNTTFTISTVLCAFMGGLALGSYAGGRLIDRRNDPLRVFAILEGTIGLYCLLLPWLIDAIEPIYRFIYQNTQTNFYIFNLIRFLFCGLLLLVPATFMGATLPVLSRFFVRCGDRIGWPVGALYAINTFGAVVGVAAAGFWLIPALGVSRTIGVACLLNGLVAGVAYLLHRLGPSLGRTAAPGLDHGPQPPTRPIPEGPAVYGQPVLVVLLVGYGLSGLAALVYEIAWTRVLSLIIGSSVYAFSMMLTAFILGLAVGAMAAAGFADRLRDPLRTLAGVEVAIGVSALIVVPLFGWLPLWVTGLITRSGGSFWQLQLMEFSLVLLIMLVPTMLMGAAFPLASRIMVQTPVAVGRSVGKVYSCNTLGSIVGSFVGGFVLIPWLGLQNTIVAAAVVNVLVGCGFVGLSPHIRPVFRVVAAAVVLVAVGVGIQTIPPWDIARMSFGPFVRAHSLSQETEQSTAELDRIAHGAKVLFHKEGLTTTVTVKEDRTGQRHLMVNAKTDASSVADLGTQVMVAHVPLLAHPEPRRVLVIGLASGVTLGSAGRHPVEELDCVEISPAVVEACRYFDEYNHHVLDDPRLKLIVADGRNHLALTARQYDVIISEPSNPWIAGIADLMTAEYFQLCHRRLAPGGIACVWLDAYTLDHESYRTVVRTFGSVFEQMSIWMTPRGYGDYMLIGFKAEPRVDYEVLAGRMRQEAVATDLKRIGIETVPQFLAHLVMGSQGAARFAQGAPVHTDDNALVEFAAPRSHAEGRKTLLHVIEKYRDADLSFLTGGVSEDAGDGTLNEVKNQGIRLGQAKGWVSAAVSHYVHGRPEQAIEALRQAARLNRSDAQLEDLINSLHSEVGQLIGQREFTRAIGLCRLLLTVDPDRAALHYDLAVLLERQGDVDAAIAHYTSTVRLDPDHPIGHSKLGQALVSMGQAEEGLKHLRQALRLQPNSMVLNNTAWLLATHRDPQFRQPDEAIQLAERASELTMHQKAAVEDTLAAAYAAAGRFARAVETAQRAIGLASSAGADTLADQIRVRLQGYRNKEPYLEAARAPAGSGRPKPGD